MTKRHQPHLTIAIMAFLLSFAACKKDKSESIPEMKKLYGTWEWVQSSGGFGGGGSTPSSVGYTQTLEFNKNGTMKRFKNELEESQLFFSITKGSTIYSSGNATLINYTSNALSHSHDQLTTQSVSFGGQDTLFLNDECYDCYGYVYIRKK